MPTPDKADAKTEAYLGAVLEKLRGDLAYGAEDVLRTRYLAMRQPNGWHLGPAETVGRMLAFLAEEKNRERYFKPGKKFLADGETMLQKVTKLLPFQSDAARDLAQTEHMATAGMSADEVTHHLVNKAESRAGNDFLRDDFRRPEPPNEAKVRHALKYFGNDIRPAVVDALCREWGPRIGNRQPSEVLAKVMEFLSQPWHAKDVTQNGQPIKMDHQAWGIRGESAREYNQEYVEKYGDQSVHDATLAVVAQLPSI